MDGKASAAVGKAEDLILPLSALVTFAGDDLRAAASGGIAGVIALESGYLQAWHAPTFTGFLNAVTAGPLGSGAGTAIAGWIVEWFGAKAGQPTISRVGRDVFDAGTGVMLGAVADVIVRPTKYNPGTGGAQGLNYRGGSNILGSVGYVETGKAGEISLMNPR